MAGTTFYCDQPRVLKAVLWNNEVNNLNAIVFQVSISVGGIAAEHGGFADRSRRNRSTADDALWDHTSTWVWWPARPAWEDWVPTAWVGQPLSLASCRTRQYQSLFVICCSGYMTFFDCDCRLWLNSANVSLSYRALTFCAVFVL